jgi:hypothetical protein
MFSIKPKAADAQATDNDIKKLTSKLSFWQSVHFLMSAWYVDNPDGTKEEAYNYGLDHFDNKDDLRFALEKIINFGSTAEH